MPEGKYRERRSAHVDETEEKEPIHESPAAGFEERVGQRIGRERPEDTAMPGGEEELAFEEPSFLEIVQSLAIQALQFLGEVPIDETGARQTRPREAKHVIDLLAVLEEKTRGNLDPQEAALLERMLSDLRVRYLQIS